MRARSVTVKVVTQGPSTPVNRLSTPREWCTRMGFAEALRALMAERGMSQRALARRVPCDKGLISRYIDGKQPPSQRMARLIDDVLSASGELVALAAQPVRAPVPALDLPEIAPDPDLFDRLTRAVDVPARVDAPVIEWLEHTLAEHRRVEDTIGARPLFRLVRGQLSAVAAFTRAAPGPLRDRLVDLTSQYAQFLAWMCIETRNHGAALAWYDRAHDWAMEAGDVNMAATTLSMKAHLAWSLGEPQRCVRMADAARWYRGVTPGVQGMAAQMAARGHALAGEADAAHALLDEAQALIVRAAGHAGDEPPWMYFYGETWFRLQRGMAELHLGNWRAAAELLASGLAALPESYRRDRAWYGACLARAHAEAGNAEQAEAVAVRFAADIAAVNSYARGELVDATRTLTRRGARQAETIREALGEDDGDELR
jgi:transcriptional regulator with XRE-family HTH domain